MIDRIITERQARINAEAFAYARARGWFRTGQCEEAQRAGEAVVERLESMLDGLEADGPFFDRTLRVVLSMGGVAESIIYSAPGEATLVMKYHDGAAAQHVG